jgi:hypothetical protein
MENVFVEMINMDSQTNFDDYRIPQKSLVDFGMTFDDYHNAEKEKYNANNTT